MKRFRIHCETQDGRTLWFTGIENAPFSPDLALAYSCATKGEAVGLQRLLCKSTLAWHHTATIETQVMQ